MRRICTFDIYGTLFDMRTVVPTLEGAVPDPEAFYRLYRWKGIQYLMIVSAIGRFQDLTTLQEKAFDFCAQELTTGVSEEVKRNFLKAFLYLKPFDDVRDGLERLRKAGVKTIALSTGTKAHLLAMIANAKLDDCFDDVISNQEAGVYKPHPHAYLYAAEKLAVKPSQIRMIASHPWDLIGARNAGFAQAWLRRSKSQGFESQTYDPIDVVPEIIGSTLPELADKIIAVDR
jgi:2-haloacid dehalogenase